MVATAALAAVPLLEPIARGTLQLAQTPIMGWERVKTYTKGRKHPVNILERSSFTLRAWEVGVLGLGALAIAAVLASRKAKEEEGRVLGPWEFLQEFLPFPFAAIPAP